MNPTSPTIALPPQVQPALDLFVTQLRSSLGANLVSVVLYGGVAKGRYDPAHSDVNVMVVLREAPLDALDLVAAAAAPARREITLRLLTLAERDLADCIEVFATKFLDIRRSHLLLDGADVLSALDISKERLLRQARRELVNLQLRLRQTYLDSAGRPEILEAHLQRGATTLFLNLGVLIELKTGARHDTFAEIADAAAVIGFDAAALRELRALRRERAATPDLHQLCDRILGQLDAALRLASTL